MKKIVSIIMIGILVLSMIGCKVGSTSTVDSNADASNISNQEMKITHIGDAILKNPVRELSEDIYSDTGIMKTDQYGQYTKEMIVYGITFIADENIPDEYMLKIAKTTKQIFAVDENTNKQLQENVLQNMYRYKALVPVVYSEETMIDPSEFMVSSSICDIIMYESNVRAMEVVEHILHTVTDVGLHYADIDNFGITETSKLYNIMQKHIEAGDYNVSNYKDLSESIKNRVLLQEFIYWGITSEWDIQKQFGTGENEWAYQSSKLMKENASEFDKLFHETISTIITSPDIDMLNLLLK